MSKTKVGSLIYIPLWLDLLLLGNAEGGAHIANLHSTMVRFIIVIRLSEKVGF